MKDLLDKTGLREEKVEVELKTTIVKHLQVNEEICPTCKGLGLLKNNAVFGIKGTKSTSGTHYPFSVEHVNYCTACYNGVVRRCEHCKEFMKRGYNSCQCEEATRNTEQEKKLKAMDRLNKLPEITITEAFELNDTVYVDNYEEYVHSGDWDDWLEDKKEEYKDLDVTTLIIYPCTITYMSVDATRVIEMALEDSHEDAEVSRNGYDELEELLDKWCEKHKTDSETYYPDESKLVRL